MNYTQNYNLKKQELTDPSDIRINGENADVIDALIHDIHEDGGDIKIRYSDEDLDTDITSFPTYLGKIFSGMPLAKFVRDFIAGMQYMIHVGKLKNDALTTEQGYALDARMGKTLNDRITSLNDSFQTRHLDYAHRTILRTGTMSIGAETYQITQRGWIFAYNIYAAQLGSTGDDNNFYIVLQVNNQQIGDSQSYTPKERGGSISAMVYTGDTIKIILLNHNIESCSLVFVPMVE